jgi:acetyltransferase-like isoleucine patch superfamily enzyme
MFWYKGVAYDSFPNIKGSVLLQGRGSITIGNGVEINSGLNANPVGLGTKTVMSVAEGAQLTIGNEVGISNALLYAVKEIQIEDEVLIGGGTQIIDNDFHSIYYKERMLRQYAGVQSQKVHIKRGAFVGMNCTVLKGVVIGERSVIAAGSLVVKTVPDDELWGGNPAKFIKKLA